MTRINLFFMQRPFGGGTTSYLVHLFKGLQLAGYDPRIYRVSKTSERNERLVGQYMGVQYRNVDGAEARALAKTAPTLFAASCNPKQIEFDTAVVGDMLKLGARIVLHDHTETQNFTLLGLKVQRPIVIRIAVDQAIKDAVFIPHPYHRRFKEWRYSPGKKRELRAVSVARVAPRKRTHIIVDANKLLDGKDQVIISGHDHRIYSHHVLKVKHEMKQEIVKRPMVWGAGADMCRTADFAVDFTHFPNDGGGTQYTFMEAWDAGTVNIVHEDWLRYPGSMNRYSCLSVTNAEELAGLLRIGKREHFHKLITKGYDELRGHMARDVAEQTVLEISR